MADPRVLFNEIYRPIKVIVVDYLSTVIFPTIPTSK